MKLLFVGSLINDKTLDELTRKSKVKASNAPVNFENMLVKGLEENGAETDVLSLPTVSMYPNGVLFAWGRRTEKLNFGKKVVWLPCINVLGLKQFTANVSSYIEIFKWLFKNRKVKDKAILNYSVYPPYSKATQKLGKLFKTQTCCVVTDLPEYLYQMGKASGLRKKLNNYYSKKMVKYQSRYDTYVFLTEHMAKRMKLENRPSMLMEGFADSSMFDGIPRGQKQANKTVMYAGRLSEDFNIRALLDGFMQTSGDYRLALFGSGDMVEYIKACEEKDNRIHYYGMVDRKDLLTGMKRAHLLISVKSPNEDHANYAFPSKILEYMTSGTAVASTTVGGIPKAYFDYIYPIKDESAEAIRDCIQKVLEEDAAVLEEKGQKSKAYALDEKNYKVQGKRIVEFLGKMM